MNGAPSREKRADKEGEAVTTIATEQPMIGEPAPVIELPGIDGNTHALADQRGKFVVIHFGASW